MLAALTWAAGADAADVDARKLARVHSDAHNVSDVVQVSTAIGRDTPWKVGFTADYEKGEI